MKEEIVDALQESKHIDKIEETNNKGRVVSIISIVSGIYGNYFFSSFFLPVGLLLSLLGVTISSTVKNKLGILLGIIGLVITIIGLFNNEIWLTKWD